LGLCFKPATVLAISLKAPLGDHGANGVELSGWTLANARAEIPFPKTVMFATATVFCVCNEAVQALVYDEIVGASTSVPVSPSVSKSAVVINT
jgi:hypothetical protein